MYFQHTLRRRGLALFAGSGLFLGLGGFALAAIVPDVQSTRHNLSASNTITAGAGSSFGTTVKATSETQVCVFCHTPHAATSGGTVVAPLWNRTLSTQTYTFYDSTSMDASMPSSVGVGSKLCLSCHDGTIAIGTVGVLNNAPGNIAMQGTSGGMLPPGSSGVTTGFTRNISTNLTNDHPISFTYDAAQTTADGELFTPGSGGAAVASRTRTVRPTFPLVSATGGQGSQLECITCHDPHLKSDAVDGGGNPINNKFLRGNRLQNVASPTDGTFNATNDIMCLACHNKAGWAGSAHANSTVANEQFTSAAAQIRDFRSTVLKYSPISTHHD